MALHNTVVSLQNNVNDYRGKLAVYSNDELLEKALSRGEISLTEHIYELSLYYESLYKVLDMERSLQLAYCELIRNR